MQDIRELQTAWERTPPQAVSLHWIREMVAAYMGVETPKPAAPKIAMTDKAKAWLEATLEEMGGVMSPVVFESLNEWEVEREQP